MNPTQHRIPLSVYVLAFTIFGFTTSEFMVSGLMVDLSRDLHDSISSIGYLISIYSLAMVFLSPVLSVFLSNIESKTSLITITLVFILGEVTAALAGNYSVLVIGRILTGTCAGAAYGITISLAASAVDESLRGKVVGLVMGGNTVGTMIGLPLASFLGNYFSWRFAFLFVAILALLSLVLIIATIHRTRNVEPIRIREQVNFVRDLRLWAAYATSGLLIGAVFVLFSYITPIFEQKSHFSSRIIPFLLFIYGVFCVLGIYVMSKFAQRHYLRISFLGAIMIVIANILFIFFDENKAISLFALLILGLFGVSLNPAFGVRVMNISGVSFLVNALHASIICFGIFLGSLLGGVVIHHSHNLRVLYPLSICLALLGVLSLIKPLWKQQVKIR